jgi:hypothetical protein
VTSVLSLEVPADPSIEGGGGQFFYFGHWGRLLIRT